MTGEPPEISEREREILQLVATGATNQQIAAQLHISTNTVKGHLRNINAKIGANSRTEATLYAVRRGWVKVQDETATEAADTAVAVDELPESEPLTEPPVDEISVVSPAEPETPAAPTATETPTTPAASHVDEPQRTLPVDRRVLIASSLLLFLLVAGLLFVFGRSPSTAETLPATAVEGTGGQPGGVTDDERSNVTILDASDHWRELASLPAGRANFALASLGYDGAEYLFAVGGDVEGTVSGSLLRYDIRGGTWAERSPKPTPVSDVQAAVVSDILYVPGGRLASGQVSNVLEAYDPRTDSWQTLQPLPQPLSAYTLVSFEGKVYLFGGWDGTTYRAEVWQYDPDEDSWLGRTPLPTPRAFAGSALLDGYIYVVGGENTTGLLDSNVRYTPADDRSGGNPWVARAQLPAARSRMATAEANGRLFLFGGLYDTSSLLIYDSRRDAWEPQPVPLADLHGLRAEALGDTLYILGGRSETAASARLYAYRAFYTLVLPLGQ